MRVFRRFPVRLGSLYLVFPLLSKFGIFRELEQADAITSSVRTTSRYTPVNHRYKSLILRTTRSTLPAKYTHTAETSFAIVPSMTSCKNHTHIQPQPEDSMWVGLQDRIDARFTLLFDEGKNCKNLYELFIDRETILFKPTPTSC